MSEADTLVNDGDVVTHEDDEAMEEVLEEEQVSVAPQLDILHIYPGYSNSYHRYLLFYILHIDIMR